MERHIELDVMSKIILYYVITRHFESTIVYSFSMSIIGNKEATETLCTARFPAKYTLCESLSVLGNYRKIGHSQRGL